jgi:hypothetical protein
MAGWPCKAKGENKKPHAGMTWGPKKLCRDTKKPLRDFSENNAKNAPQKLPTNSMT